jgi:Cu/Ag efflux pump CusA
MERNFAQLCTCKAQCKKLLRTAYVFVQHLIEAIEEGAVLRVRPKAMTVTVIVGGLLPTMFGGGAGSEVMRRIAAPTVGGMRQRPDRVILFARMALRGR